MREATLVPEHKVADAPTVAVNKFILKAMREQLFEQRAGIGFVVPLDGDHRMLRVGEERLTAGLWMGADDWMYGQRCPGPQIVIQYSRFALFEINTTPPLQRLTPFGQPVIRCVCIGKPSVPPAIQDFDRVEHRPRCGPLIIRGIEVPHRSHIRKADIITGPLSGQYQQVHPRVRPRAEYRSNARTASVPERREPDDG